MFNVGKLSPWVLVYLMVFSLIFKVFINIHEYANEIIFIYDHCMKGLVKLYHGLYKNMQNWWFVDGLWPKYVYL